MTFGEDLALFEVPTPAPLSKPLRDVGNGAPVWTKYRPKDPLKCDDCNLFLHQSRGSGPAARRAYFRRKARGVDLLLCSEHAQLRREDDGLEQLKEGGTA